MSAKIKLYPLKSCNECPALKIERTPGAGYAEDYRCGLASNKLIYGYVEWPSEGPQEGVFPKCCPLKNRKKS